MKRLLIIEDDGDTLEMLGYAAESPNFEVFLKPEIPPIEEIQKLNPDLILLDHWVTGKTGGQFCKEIKSNPLTNHIPIVLMSAVRNIGQIAADCGAEGSLSKPFDIDEVEDVFQVYLG